MKETFKILRIFAAISLLMIISCDKSREHVKVHNSEATIENFDTFFDKFHKDSLFQLSRIKFPLNGGPGNGQINDEWTKENWRMLKTKIQDVDTTQFKVSYRKLEQSFIAKVWLENSGFSCEYKYEIMNNKWYLVAAFEQDN